MNDNPGRYRLRSLASLAALAIMLAMLAGYTQLPTLGGDDRPGDQMVTPVSSYHELDRLELPSTEGVGSCTRCHEASAHGRNPELRAFLNLHRLKLDCTACHSAAASVLDQVTFPSGVSIGDLGSSAVCMVCHQGRQSTDGVEAALAGLDDDAVSPELGFVNIHYRAAAASLMGTEGRGGFEYPGKTYAGRFAYVPDFNTCTTCHDPHGLQVRAEPCTECHKTADLMAIRTRPADVDGDGDTGEGVAGEIASLHDALGRAISAYAAQIADAPLVYAPDAYPYFFGDLNGNGALDAEEAAYPNRYQSWTPRLLRAAYNYQFIAKDPGIYAHNPTYAIQLLIDSIDDLGESTGVVAGNRIRP